MLDFVFKESNAGAGVKQFTTTSFDHNHNRGDVVYVIVERDDKKEMVSEPLTVSTIIYNEHDDLNKSVGYTLKDMEGDVVQCIYSDANMFISHEQASNFLSSEAVEPF